MNRGSLGARKLNVQLQAVLNPLRAGDIEVERSGSGIQIVQTENNYEKEVFNRDIGQVESINAGEREVAIRYYTRLVTYGYGEQGASR